MFYSIKNNLNTLKNNQKLKKGSIFFLKELFLYLKNDKRFKFDIVKIDSDKFLK